jgi:hypothetical protein
MRSYKQTAPHHAQLVKAYNKGKGTVIEYCHRHHINTKTFYYWHKRLRAQNQEIPSFLPALINSTTMQTKESEKKTEYFSVHIPNGIELSIPMISNAAFLETLIGALKRGTL